MLARRLVPIVLAAALAAACVPPTGAGGGKPATGKGAGVRPTSGPGAGGEVPPVVAGGPPGTSRPGGLDPAMPLGTPRPVPSGPSPLQAPPVPVVVTADGATLTGKVKLPSGLIGVNGSNIVSNNGGSVISDHGGSVVSNNGGSVVGTGGGRYRLRALAQEPLGGVTVRLLDAAGQPVADAAGQPLTAQAGPDGTYAFKAALPAANLVLEVTLPGGKGTLQAIAPPTADARKRTDVDLVGTLSTGYILDKYVRPQADARAVLEKLPADVERQTRERVEAALVAGQEAGKVVLPVVLTSAAAKDTVDALGAADQALAAQLEVLKKLFIAAGLTDLGSGQLATDVGLRWISLTAAAPDGTAYFYCEEDARVWRLGADGRLATALGKGPDARGGGEDPTGTPAAELPLDEPLTALAVLPDGRLLALGPHVLLCVERDGRVTRLAADLDGGAGLAIAPDGRAWVLTHFRFVGHGVNHPARLLRVGEQGVEPVLDLDHERATQLEGLRHFAVDEAGRAVFVVPDDVRDPDAQAPPPPRKRVLALELAGGTLTEQQVEGRLLVDDRGGHWRPAAGRTLKAEEGGASVALGEGLAPADLGALARLPGGELLYNDGNRLYRLGAAGARLIAGQVGVPRETAAGAIRFADPQLLAAEPGGRLHCYDAGTGWLWRIDPGARARVAAELPKVDFFADAATVAAAPPNQLRGEIDHLRAGKDGSTWLYDGGFFVANADKRLLRIHPDGKLEVAWKPRANPDPSDLGGVFGEKLIDFLPLDDGGLLMLTSPPGIGAGLVLERRPPTGPAVAVPLAPEVASGLTPDGMVALPNGEVGLLGINWAMWRVRLADGQATLVSPPRPYQDFLNTRWCWPATDAAGRLVTVERGLYLVDPVKEKIWSLAGSNGWSSEAPGPLFFKGVGPTEGIGDDLRAPAVDAAGNVSFIDADYRLIKRIPAGELPR